MPNKFAVLTEKGTFYFTSLPQAVKFAASTNKRYNERCIVYRIETVRTFDSQGKQHGSI